jgi:hypothetical protein
MMLLADRDDAQSQLLFLNATARRCTGVDVPAVDGACGAVSTMLVLPRFRPAIGSKWLPRAA